MMEGEMSAHWYAARVISGTSIIDRHLQAESVHCYRTKYAPGIVFMRCTEAFTSSLVELFMGKVYFYRTPDRKKPAVIEEKQMNNFILVTSVSDDIINLGVVTPDFLVGDRVRVKGGLFQGAEGVIKRIKGDRRLIVSIDGVTAVATAYIRPELLDPVVEEKNQGN